jgi:hypothetical protein
VTVLLDELSFQRFDREDVGDGSEPIADFSTHTFTPIVAFVSVTVKVDIPAGGITEITVADVLEALASPVIENRVEIGGVPVTSPILKDLDWVNAHDSADHTHIIGSYLHGASINTTPTDAGGAGTYVDILYDGEYDDPDFPTRWDGTSPLYYTNNAKTAGPEEYNYIPLALNDYDELLLDNNPVFSDGNATQRVTRLTISEETMIEYIWDQTNAEESKG